MRGQYSYFPLFLTSPLLLSQSQWAEALTVFWARTFCDAVNLGEKWNCAQLMERKHWLVHAWVYWTVCEHGCYSLPWIHIKYEQVNMKNSTKKKKKSHISRQCVRVNYAGKQLVNGVSVSEGLTFSRQVFGVKITILLKQPCLIRITRRNTLPTDRVIQ